MATFGIFTLGCKVNQYESEAIAELLEARGLTPMHADEVCDLYIINTCTVTAESDRKARQMIRRAITKNPNAYVLVTGCLAETDSDSIKNIHGVDYVCGNADKAKIADAAIELIKKGQKNGKPRLEITDIESAPFLPMRITKFDRTRAYIKIEDGCESHCSYCIIPKARGKIRSKPVDEVLDEVGALTAGGCREIVLTGIETGSYGRDIGSSLAELLEKIDKIDGIGRVRLGSLDPSIMKPDFVKRISALRSLSHHFHISMQSGSDSVLRLMRRKYNTKMALESITALREAMPDVCFTTDIIVGFPCESEENFLETVEFAKKASFLMMHVFPYSKREGTPAAEMNGQIDTTTKKRRVAELSAIGKQIRKDILEKSVNESKITKVLFGDYENGFAYGHTDNFIQVRVKTDRSLRSQLLEVKFISTDGDVIDADENDVVIDITDGSVCVIAYKPGDVTGDGRVNVRDLVRLSQYISDGCRTDPDGYNAEVIASVCDVTGDGRINTRDLIRLSQYISDGCMTDPNGYNAVLNHSKLPDCPHSDVESIVSKPFTCTEDGMCTKICRVCNFEWNEVLPASHKYFTVNSLDKEYVKYTCTACGDVYVEDTDGEKVEDASSIVFPMLYASFDDITYIDNIADKFEGISFKSAFATMVVTFTDGEESSSYVNIPTGTSAQNPNGYFEITDNKNAFASETFTISFYAMFEEYPVSGTLDLLSWTIGGTEYVLLTVDEAGNIFVIGNDDAVAPFSDKGWDKITVTVDPATGEIAFELSGADGKAVTGEGDLGASATGETDSHLRFFDSKNQFEAFIDEICISLAN